MLKSLQLLPPFCIRPTNIVTITSQPGYKDAKAKAFKINWKITNGQKMMPEFFKMITVMISF